MPKVSLKQKYRKLDISFFNDANNTDRGGSNNILTILKPSFPSSLTVNDLIKNVNTNTNNTNNKPKLFPNAFILYRMALMKEYHVKNCKLPLMGEVSKIAKNSWNMEPKHVKDFYKSLVKDAKLTYKHKSFMTNI